MRLSSEIRKRENKKINAIVQARMESTRLPGKVLVNIEGMPILEHIIRRLEAVSEVNKVIIATSNKASDNAIEEFCKANVVACVRGSETNVLDRFRVASIMYPADVYIRATGDNPMIDVKLIHDMLVFLSIGDLTYTCYKKYPIGSGVEIFTHGALLEAVEYADKLFEFEHVTPYMYQRMNKRKVEYYVSNIDESMIRMTVDTEKDLIFAKEIFRRLYKTNPLFGICEVRELLLREPNLKLINADVHQKILGE